MKTSHSHLPYKIFNQQLAIRTTTASISCFMSFLLLVMILWNQDGLKSPYSRIIFFISIGDIFASLGIIIGPHAIPKEYSDLGAYWAKGTTATCDFAGFIKTLGALYLVPFYTLLLNYYFLKRVKDKVKPAEFTTTYEKKIHVLIWVYSLATCIYALVQKLYNPSEEGKHCMIIDTRKHASCLDNDNEIVDHHDCARGDYIYRELVLLGMIPLFTTFILMISNLVRLTVFVYRQERLMEMESRESKDRKKRNSMTRIQRDEVEKEEEVEQVQEVQKNEDAAEPKQTCCGCRRKLTHNTLTRQALVQSSFYILTFLIMYSLPTITYAVNEWYGKVPTWFLWIPSILYPVNGLFTMLIFTRPKVQQVRRKFPEIADLPYIVLLLIVIFSGGETPKEIDLSSSYEEESVAMDGNEGGFVEDDNRINTQDQQDINELYVKYQISSVADDDSIFCKIRNVSKAIRMSKGNGTEMSRHERLGETNARNAIDDDGISHDEGVHSFNSSVME